jgi:hypothetical protein
VLAFSDVGDLGDSQFPDYPIFNLSSVSLCLRGEIFALDLPLTQFFSAVYCVRVRTSDFKALAWVPTR